MPIYAYRCEACGHARDVLQRISDPLIEVCPACSASSFKKQLTAAGFQLKGSGWYATDFRNGSNGKPAAENKDEAPAPAGDAATAPTPAATPKTGGEATPAAATPSAAPKTGGCGTSCACH